jgi:hypothetical protein
MTAIVQQLLRQGAKLTGHLVLVAESETGLPQHFVDNQLPETLDYIDPSGKLNKQTMLEDKSGLTGV